MNWNDFLQKHRPSQIAAEADCALTALTSLGLIRVRGEDARDFLQGQLTNDIRAVTTEQAQLSAWCNPKGRMLALMLVFQHGDDLYLQLPRERIAPVLKRLGMYVMRSRVTLSDASEELPIMAVGGDCIGGLLENQPEDDFASRQSGELSLIRFPGVQPRVQVIGTADALAAIWNKTAATATQVNEGWWRLQNIRSGIPAIYDVTAETFIPQMLNLDLLHGISFTKGCYTGQEVVARMKYLGQLKRRMYLARFAAAEEPGPGDKLFSATSKSAQGAGKLVDVQPSPAGGWEALVAAEISSVEAGDIRLGDANGPALAIQPPPYGLQAADSE
ncbi:CAF17-like 4Fe-4S cluster assembly/insertion protein YgfZ [Thiolapillus sp.]